MRLNKIGFTLMEIIIVVAIIAIISIAGFSVLRPSSRLDDANTVLRAKASGSLEVAIKRAILDNGELPTELAAIATSTPTLLVTSGAASGTYYCAKLGFSIPKVNIASQIQPLVGDLPIDPALDPASTDTGYFVVRKGNLFDVASCGDVQDCGTCTDNCTGCPVCGNGAIENGEACDDGNTIREKCGDGILQVGTYCDNNCGLEYALNEICDYNSPAQWQCTNEGDTFASAVAGSGTLCIYGTGIENCRVFLETCGGAQENNL